MVQSLAYLRESASQTAGPYVHIGLAPGAAGFDIFASELGQDIAGPAATGERIRVEGAVYDGTGTTVKDVLIEVWQADKANSMFTRAFIAEMDQAELRGSPTFLGAGAVENAGTEPR